ncbi:MAG: hypothetical protein KKI08_11025 [Armatimonadetes bacterium]|nr:hypothetical protein [Armatimonadota bacterium]
MRPALLCLALMLAAALSAADDTWRVPEADVRLPLRAEGDLYARTDAVASAVVDFSTLLGADRVLADGSLVLVDAADGQKPPLRLAQDAQLRYASGNPLLRLQWTLPRLAAFESRLLHLYCRTVAPGDAGAWQPLAETFTPGEAAGLVTSFEEPDPAHADWPRCFTAAGWDKPGEKSERVWSGEVPHSGKCSLKIARVFEGEQPANTNRPHWRTWPPPLEVREGQSVRLSAWLKSVRLQGRARAYLTMLFVDEKNQRLPTGRLSLTGGSDPHDWMFVSGVVTAPAGARGVEIQFSLVSDEGEVYCDDLQATILPGSTLPAVAITPGMLERKPEVAVVTTGKLLQVTAAAQPPVLDGALDDPCWAAAGRSDQFEVHVKASDVSPVQTTVLACADRDALYFGFICQEPPGAKLLANAAERDGPLWQDDSVELFLDTNLDRHTYYQIIVNARGVFFDQDTGAPGLAGAKWNGPITAAARVTPDGWTAEVKLQFVGLRLAEAAGSQWGANFARSSFRGSRSLYTWVKVGANFGEPARFGTLALPFDPAADVITGRPLLAENLFFGQGGVPIEINNRRDRPAQVRAVVSLDDGNTRPLGETTVMAPPRGLVVARIPCAFSQPGETKLRYDLFEQPGGRLLYTTSVTHLVPEPLVLEPTHRTIYASDPLVTGHWTVALAPEALPHSSLEFTLAPAGAAQPAAPQKIVPNRSEGFYALPARLAPGAYEVQARLLQGGQAVGQASYMLQCLAGPFP